MISHPALCSVRSHKDGCLRQVRTGPWHATRIGPVLKHRREQVHKVKRTLMNRKGRKRLPDEIRKVAQIKASFTPIQIYKILTNAAKAGMSPGVFVAQAALRAEVKERLSKDVLDHIKALNRLNSTLNQILVKINADRRYYCQQQLMREIDELTHLRRSLTEKIKED